MLPIKPLSAAIALLLAAAATAPLSAQSAPPAQDDDTTTLDTITVTGTNLRGVDLAEAQPITILDADDLRRIGATSVSDALRQVSELGGGTGNFTTANSGTLQADAPAGSAGASLRGLGTASTLTLVNGRRVAAASFANGSENFVDINAIPLAAIDRIEVLAAGASAIYGADAVAGVVNIVLLDRFDGLRTSVSYGDSTRDTDEARMNANLVAGFGNDDAGGVVVIDAFRRNAFYNRDRAITAVEPRPSQQGFFPSWNDLDFAQDDIVEAQCPDADFGVGGFGEFCAVNRNAFTAADPQLEQIGAYATYSWRFDSVELFGELQLQRNTSEANSSPAPWDAEASFDNPNLPADFRARYLALGFDPTALIGFGRFPDARTIEVTTTNARALVGLRGSLGDWGWESALNGGTSRSEQVAVAGIYNVARFQAALFGELCADGTVTCSPGSGGLWYNPFGGQSVQDPQVLALVRERVPREGRSRAVSWDLEFSGELGELGGGAIATAFGTEVRYERIDDSPSPLATADEFGDVPVYGFGSTAVDASRTSSSAYGEVLLPFTSTFDVRLAGRYDHYSDFGGDFNPSVGLRFRPHDSLVLRGGWNTSYRAPSLAQVGAGTTLSSGALPCAAGSEFRDNFCRGSSRDVNYLSQIFGNPDLEAETSTAWSAGLVWSPGDATSIALDYWSFDQENLVDIADLDLFRAALTDPSLLYTTAGGSRPRPPGAIGIVTRDGTINGRIDEVFLELTNVGVQRTEGLDIDLRQRLSSDFAGGELRAWLDATWVRSFERSEQCSPSTPTRRGQGACLDGSRIVELVDEFRYPEWLGNVGLSWEGGALEASLWANFVDSYFDDDTRAGVPANRRVGSWATLNASFGWDVSDVHYVGLTLRNLADRDPPLALGAGSNVDTFNHNARGREFQLQWIGRF